MVRQMAHRHLDQAGKMAAKQEWPHTEHYITKRHIIINTMKHSYQATNITMHGELGSDIADGIQRNGQDRI